MKGLRVILAPTADSPALYSYPVPEAGARGTVTAVRTDGSVRTYIAGPGPGLVYVEWDVDGLVCAVSPSGTSSSSQPRLAI